MSARLTKAQRECLQLAALEPIRYYKGGYYSTPCLAGNSDAPDAPPRRYTTTQTLRSLVTKGMLLHVGALSIYGERWTITPAGNAALASSERK